MTLDEIIDKWSDYLANKTDDLAYCCIVEAISGAIDDALKERNKTDNKILSRLNSIIEESLKLYYRV